MLWLMSQLHHDTQYTLKKTVSSDERTSFSKPTEGMKLDKIFRKDYILFVFQKAVAYTVA